MCITPLGVYNFRHTEYFRLFWFICSYITESPERKPWKKKIMLPFLLSFPNVQRSTKPVRVAGLCASHMPRAPPYFSVAGCRAVGPNFQKWRIQACDNGDSLHCPKQLEKPVLVFQSRHSNCQQTERKHEKIASLSQAFCFLVLSRED